MVTLVLGAEVAVKTALASRDFIESRGDRGRTFPANHRIPRLLDAGSVRKMQRTADCLTSSIPVGNAGQVPLLLHFAGSISTLPLVEEKCPTGWGFGLGSGRPGAEVCTSSQVSGAAVPTWMTDSHRKYLCPPPGVGIAAFVGSERVESSSGWSPGAHL